MQEFRFEDKERKVSFRGVVSHNDKNLPAVTILSP